ncbi:Uncharacterized conserved protein YciI, contains a putative active-site phosphohistidine [Andreprevotia lacus DSM 23236]|jgi:uncharacterized protein YciI|uniref:Uncharacterized conserved protein YciI, contains a putative active-site phosphohistidine n=1 Tax=Andreprevotia lacus DSM 23236 TaxID=1121001 RepID=A0A1W1XC13_9NEIS|nr:YciI family protein [Andreprevotia lacus]SMC21390.1 Uncharacterized conserved protein YciI, contains a putative active-site phosphohistidine [Andreprevotia lacus DSM 23236]
MFVVLLEFATNKSQAAHFMEGHKAWLQRGFDDGVFQLSGSVLPAAGGAVLAHGVTRAELEQRVAQDPFVAEGVVGAKIIEIAPSRASEPLAFLLA